MCLSNVLMAPQHSNELVPVVKREASRKVIKVLICQQNINKQKCKQTKLQTNQKANSNQLTSCLSRI